MGVYAIVIQEYFILEAESEGEAQNKYDELVRITGTTGNLAEDDSPAWLLGHDRDFNTTRIVETADISPDRVQRLG